MSVNPAFSHGVLCNRSARPWNRRRGSGPVRCAAGRRRSPVRRDGVPRGGRMSRSAAPRRRFCAGPAPAPERHLARLGRTPPAPARRRPHARASSWITCPARGLCTWTRSQVRDGSAGRATLLGDTAAAVFLTRRWPWPVPSCSPTRWRTGPRRNRRGLRGDNALVRPRMARRNVPLVRRLLNRERRRPARHEDRPRTLCRASRSAGPPAQPRKTPPDPEIRRPLPARSAAAAPPRPA
jgi:hypothetical protein